MTIEDIARISHEIFRNFNKSIGAQNELSWNELNQWRRNEIIDIVSKILNYKTGPFFYDKVKEDMFKIIVNELKKFID